MTRALPLKSISAIISKSSLQKSRIMLVCFVGRLIRRWAILSSIDSSKHLHVSGSSDAVLARFFK